MSVIVVGTMAFDAIETPFGKSDKIIGGSATYVAYAASNFVKPVQQVSIVGYDFPLEELEELKKRGVGVEGVEIVKDKKSFFWSGKYHMDMNTRDTLVTDLNVLADFNPTIPESYQDAEFLMLGNLMPKLQKSVIEQMRKRPKLIVLDTMNFWMESALDDLKEVLNLNRIYAANPNAVAMQVYAAGIVYNALRVAQGEVAAAAGIEPEEISPAKFFPKMVAACQTYVVAQQWERRVRRINPHRRLRMLDWRTERWASVSVPLLHVEARSETRRHRRYCPARRHWKSLAHVPGGRRLTKLS